MSDPIRTRQSRLTAAMLGGIVLGGCMLLGCNLDRPLAPELTPEPAISSSAVLELTIVGERGEPLPGAPLLGRLYRPEDIAAAMRALPPAARNELGARGTCITSDAGFRAVVRQLLGLGPDERGVAGHIDNSSWGRVKAHFYPS